MQAKKAGLVTRFSSGSKRIMMKMQDVVVALVKTTLTAVSSNARRRGGETDLKTAVDISESSPPGTQRFSVLWITKRSSRIGDGSLEALEAQSSSWHAAQQPDGRLNSSISAVMLKAPGPLTRLRLNKLASTSDWA